MSAGAAGAAAAAAAAAQARRERAEEEQMTDYKPEDLAAGWEFKILRSATSRFKDPDFLRQTLADEARAGWTMLEKFDNGRVRVKRPAADKSRDASLGFDPYRTWVGISDNQFALRIILTVFGVLALVGMIAFLATR
jgi:hypothetical protein